MRNISSLTNKDFKLLDPGVGTIAIRRTLASEGVAGHEQVSMMTTSLDPFTETGISQQAHCNARSQENQGMKRKSRDLEDQIQALKNDT